eukprot:1311558-Pyramimonas_sp.AAC.1
MDVRAYPITSRKKLEKHGVPVAQHLELMARFPNIVFSYVQIRYVRFVSRTIGQNRRVYQWNSRNSPSFVPGFLTCRDEVVPPRMRNTKGTRNHMASDDYDEYWDENEQDGVKEEEEEEFVDPELLAELEDFKRMGLPTGFTATTKQSKSSRSRKRGGRRNKPPCPEDDVQMEDPQGSAAHYFIF